jgi:xanthine dehydrogenase molybdopterin-binding subunit B
VGNVDEAFKTCDFVFEGETFVNGQEHFYLETQTSLCIPGETDEMLIWASTQNPNETQVILTHSLTHTLSLSSTRLTFHSNSFDFISFLLVCFMDWLIRFYF